MPSNLPITRQLSILDREITLTADRLRPRADTVLPRCLRSMLTAGMGLSPAIDPAIMMDVYQYALVDLPAAALTEATERLIRGQIKRDTLRIIPIPPELAAIVRIEAATMYTDLRRMQETRDTLHNIMGGRQPKDEASKARVRELVAAVKAKNAEGDNIFSPTEPE